VPNLNSCEVYFGSGERRSLTPRLFRSWFAAEQGGASKMSPGHEMQEHGSVKGQPGASGYAPGHEMKEHGSRDRDDVNMTRERKDVR
jgi:hypothetical protein